MLIEHSSPGDWWGSKVHGLVDEHQALEIVRENIEAVERANLEKRETERAFFAFSKDGERDYIFLTIFEAQQTVFEYGHSEQKRVFGLPVDYGCRYEFDGDSVEVTCNLVSFYFNCDREEFLEAIAKKIISEDCATTLKWWQILILFAGGIVALRELMLHIRGIIE